MALVDSVIGSFIPRGCDDYRSLQGFTHYKCTFSTLNYVGLYIMTKFAVAIILNVYCIARNNWGK